jgi:predicted phage terminase large subunit-like protein
VGFGRQVRNLLQSGEYKEVFEGVTLSADSKAAGRWNTNKMGEYYAVGVGGAMTGKGADILMIDDPHSEQDAAQGAYNPEVYDKVYEWYTSGPRQRLQPGGAIIVVMTRWSKRDLTGQLLKQSMKSSKGEEWEVIELPALMPSGDPLWPEYWSKNEIEALREELPVPKWMAQYQQNPTSEEGALIKREWWRVWTRDTAPQCEAIIQSWDTAFLKTERSNYSACTTWGIFKHPNEQGVTIPQLIMLHAFKGKFEFPELKKEAYNAFTEWEPDQIVIEQKASGGPLAFELRAMGIPITEFAPTRGQDKIARVNAVTDLFASGMVWTPERKWADEVIEECAAFPSGDDDDYVDSVSQALLRFRQGGWIRTDMDEEDIEMHPRQRIEYY